MAVEKVQIGVTGIKELLDNGYTWLKKDDLGYGSVQEKYQASEVQINTIRKHPALKDLETTARIFVIIDDTKDGTTTTATVSERRDAESLGSISKSDKKQSGKSTEVSGISNSTSTERVPETSDADSFSAFANL